jgi:transposase InsO family protein
MKLHANAALSLNKRRLLAHRVVDEVWSLAEAAKAAEVSEPTARKWVTRYRAEGKSGLIDRPSSAHHVHNRTPEDRIAAICALRRLRFTGAELAEIFGMPETTVSGILTPLGPRSPGAAGPRAGAALSALSPRRARPHRRREARPDHRRRRAPVHGIPALHPEAHRPSGPTPRNRRLEFVHVCVDDATRFAYAEVLGDERATTALVFLRRAIRFFARHGVTVERVLTDNGSAYISTVHAVACRALGIKHLRPRPRRPQTNGKAERFIRTLLGGWAYGALYRSSAERTAALEGWLWRYNYRRKHGALGRRPPAALLTELNNALGSYIQPPAPSD